MMPERNVGPPLPYILDMGFANPDMGLRAVWWQQYLADSLQVYNRTITAREAWYERQQLGIPTTPAVLKS